MTTKTDMNLIESILETISKAKAVEDGRLSVEEMVGATERDEIQERLNTVTDTILDALEQADFANDPRLQELFQVFEKQSANFPSC